MSRPRNPSSKLSQIVDFVATRGAVTAADVEKHFPGCKGSSWLSAAERQRRLVRVVRGVYRVRVPDPSVYPYCLGDAPRGSRFYMRNYDGLHMRVRLPEDYVIGLHRVPLTADALNRGEMTHVRADGDLSIPVLDLATGHVFLMAASKPICIQGRRI